MKSWAILVFAAVLFSEVTVFAGEPAFEPFVGTYVRVQGTKMGSFTCPDTLTYKIDEAGDLAAVSSEDYFNGYYSFSEETLNTGAYSCVNHGEIFSNQCIRDSSSMFENKLTRKSVDKNNVTMFESTRTRAELTRTDDGLTVSFESDGQETGCTYEAQ